MKVLRAVCRLLLGAVFILSGFFKIIDPVGTGLKVGEYLQAFRLGWLVPLSVLPGLLLAAAELLTGACVLKGVKMRFFSTAALAMMSFFTVLTFISMVWEPVSDCGCFGEALRLTNTQTFLKNVVLLGCAVGVYLQRNRFERVARPGRETVYICAYGLVVAGLAVYSLVNLPLTDFGPYKPGTELSAAAGAEREYETTFIYAKDGLEQEFDLEHLPDSTWQFVDARTVLISGGGAGDDQTDFVLKDRDGEYVTDAVLRHPGPLFLVSLYRLGRENPRMIGRIARLRDELARLEPSAALYLLSGDTPEETEKALAGLLPEVSDPDAPAAAAVPVLYTGYKTVLTLNRSNGGLTCIDEGMIIKKWAAGRYPHRRLERLLTADSDIVAARETIREQLASEIALLIIFSLIFIL